MLEAGLHEGVGPPLIARLNEALAVPRGGLEKALEEGSRKEPTMAEKI